LVWLGRFLTEYMYNKMACAGILERRPFSFKRKVSKWIYALKKLFYGKAIFGDAGGENGR
jgi:hypothetical protein